MNDYNYRFYDIEENDNKIIDKIVENITKIHNNNRNKNKNKKEIKTRKKRTEEVFNYIKNSLRNNKNIILNDMDINSFNFSLIDNIDNNKVKYIIKYYSYNYPVVVIIKTNKNNENEFILNIKIKERDNKIERSIELEIMKDYYKNNNNKLVRLLKKEDAKIDLKITYNILYELFE